MTREAPLVELQCKITCKIGGNVLGFWRVCEYYIHDFFFKREIKTGLPFSMLYKQRFIESTTLIQGEIILI